MKPRELEEELRRRASRLAEEPLEDEGAAERLLESVARELDLPLAQRAPPRTHPARRPSRMLFLAALAAAAALALLIGPLSTLWRDGARGYGSVPLDVALLDGASRRISSLSRDAAGAPDAPDLRPGRLNVEVEAPEGAWLQLYLYGPDGRRHAPLGPAGFEQGAAVSYPLADHDLSAYEALPEGPSYLTVFAIGAPSPIPEGRLSAILPTRLDSSAGTARLSAEDALASRLQEDLGCGVVVQSFILESR